jgi:class 3 adenylate cyclase
MARPVSDTQYAKTVEGVQIAHQTLGEGPVDLLMTGAYFSNLEHECEVFDGKVSGLTVSIGARVAAQADPSEVLGSQTVRDLVAGSDLAFDEAGEHELKGVPDRWRLYRVRAGSPGATA